MISTKFSSKRQYFCLWSGKYGKGRKNEFLLARIRSVFKKWFHLISVTFSASRKELPSEVDGLH